jgi:hypothetical protein
MATNEIGFKRTKICFNNITQDGAVCKNPKITFEGASDCVSIACELENNCWEVQVVDGCDLDCFYVTVDCEDCGKCPPVRKKICLCDTSDDCDECSFCSPDGFCTELCPNSICDGGDCVECITNNDCPCNLECVQGECKCPGDKPFLDAKGCCVECNTDNECQGCDVCVGGDCVPKQCPPNQLLNPINCNCSECITNSDCGGANECCVGGDCLCCAGYYRDPATGNCIVTPDCFTNEDCGGCDVCVAGGCQTPTCPLGFILSADCDCVEECDCGNPQCPSNKSCVPVNLDGDCGCVSCFGSCSKNSDCGEGCYCDNGVCRKNPCTGACVDGQDCPQGCGCDGNKCYPCTSFDCLTSECNNVDGCQCQGNSCQGTPCSGDCSNGNDCGEGCGCLNGKCVSCVLLECNGQCENADGCNCDNNICNPEPCNSSCDNAGDCGFGCGCLDKVCVECESQSCNGNENCPEGCYCDNGVCKKSPCAEVFCSSPNDCGLGCGCDNGKCVPCDSLDCGAGCEDVAGCDCVNGNCEDDNDPTCKSELKFTKGDCDLTLSLTTEDTCLCDDLFFRSVLSGVTAGSMPNTSDFTYTVDLVKDTGVLLSSTGVVNEIPLTGSVRVIVTNYLVRVNSQNQIIPNTPIVTNEYSHTENVGQLTPSTFNANFTNIPNIGSTIVVGNNIFRVFKTEFFVRTMSNLVFENNCNQSLNKTLVRSLTSQNVLSSGFTVTTKTDRNVLGRTPLFSWFKSNSASNIFSPSNLFRRAYASGSLGSYNDTITDVEGLEHGLFYGGKTNCGCDNITTYSCTSSGATRLVFCSPLGFEYSISNCGLELLIEDDVIVTCPAILNANNRPFYNVLINGTIVDTIQVPLNGLLIADQTTYTSVVPIDKIELRLAVDPCNECGIVYDTDDEYLNFEVTTEDLDCTDSGTLPLTINIVGGVAPFSYEINYPVGNQETGVINTLGSHVINLPSAGDGIYSVEITDGLGCILTKTINLQASLLDTDGLIVITPTCSPSGFSVTNNGNFVATVTGGSFGTITLQPNETKTQSLPFGVYSITKSFVGTTCTYTDNYTIDCCADPTDFTFSTTCSPNGTKSYTITNSSAFPYTVTLSDGVNPNISQLVNAGQTITIGSLSDSATYSVELSSNFGCVTALPAIFPNTCCTEFLNNILITSSCNTNTNEAFVIVTNNLQYPVDVSIDGVQLVTADNSSTIQINVAPGNRLVEVTTANITSCTKSQLINVVCQEACVCNPSISTTDGCTFDVAFTGCSFYSWIWQSRPNPSAQWADIGGTANQTSYTTVAGNTDFFRVRFFIAAGSSCPTVFTNSLQSTCTDCNCTASIALDSNCELQLTSACSGFAWVWQESVDNGQTWNSVQVNQNSFTNVVQGRVYRVLFTKPNCPQFTTNTVTGTCSTGCPPLDPLLSLNCSSGLFTLNTDDATTKGYTWVWQSATKSFPVNWQNRQTGGDNFTANSSDANLQFRVVFSLAGCPDVITNIVDVPACVNTPTMLGDCGGFSLSFSPNSACYTWFWEESTTGAGNWTVKQTFGSTFPSSLIVAGRYYRVRLERPMCGAPTFTNIIQCFPV